MKAADRQRLDNELATAREWLAISERDLERLYTWATTRHRQSNDMRDVSRAERRVADNRKRVEELEARLAAEDKPNA